MSHTITLTPNQISTIISALSHLPPNQIVDKEFDCDVADLTQMFKYVLDYSETEDEIHDFSA